jgi:hypothetical protein
LPPTVDEVLHELSVKKLYVKFFDVSWLPEANQPIPVATIAFSDAAPADVQLVPVIFITNEVLQKLTSGEIQTLAFKINKKIEDILQFNNLSIPAEIQIDCDWSETTRDKYFHLLTELKTFPLWQKTTWSATIRLHQIKYASLTGVPPVNKGLLMFYNMGNIENPLSKNSIYTSEIARLYLDNIWDYPLPLDAAIACFSWGLLFENETLLKIFYPLYPTDMPDTLFTKQDENVFTVKQDCYFEGTFLTQGNTLKLENMSPALSLESAKLLASKMKNADMSVILYHLDTSILKRYTYEEFANLYSAFE